MSISSTGLNTPAEPACASPLGSYSIFFLAFSGPTTPATVLCSSGFLKMPSKPSPLSGTRDSCVDSVLLHLSQDSAGTWGGWHQKV